MHHIIIATASLTEAVVLIVTGAISFALWRSMSASPIWAILAGFTLLAFGSAFSHLHQAALHLFHVSGIHLSVMSGEPYHAALVSGFTIVVVWGGIYMMYPALRFVFRRHWAMASVAGYAGIWLSILSILFLAS